MAPKKQACGRKGVLSAAGLPLPHFGRMTESITWIVPLVAAMSVVTTFAPSTFTLPPSTEIFTD